MKKLLLLSILIGSFSGLAFADETCEVLNGEMVCTETSVVTFQNSRESVLIEIDNLKRELQRELVILNKRIVRVTSKNSEAIKAIRQEIVSKEEKIAKMDELNLAFDLLIAPLPTEGVIDVAKN